MSRFIKKPQLFWDRVDCDSDDQCWEWQGNKGSTGYGLVYNKFGRIRAHRIAYELEVGSIDVDKEIHHKCENKLCVNPYHLQQLTRKEHATFGHNYHPTYCPYGHEYTEENTKFEHDGRRKCKQCVSKILKAYRETHIEEIKADQKQYYLQNRERLRKEHHEYYERRKKQQ